MNGTPKFTHEFQFSGGTWTDLIRSVEDHIFYQMQHPLLLDLFVEPTAKLRAVIKNNSALLVVDVDETALRIQRPLGSAGAALFQEEIRKEYGRRGILAAGLDPDLASRLPQLCPRAGSPMEQLVEWSDLGTFDIELKGGVYKPLRNSIRHAEREGIEVEAYDAAVHGKSAMKVFEEWNSVKPRVATFWIPRILERPSAVPGLMSVVALRRKKVLGVSMALVCGGYAYMLLALTLQEHGRAQELMDYQLMKTLKSAGVRRLDWGISDSGPISAYKKKYGNISLQPIRTFWIPPPVK